MLISGDIRMLHLFDKYSPASGNMSPKTGSFGYSGGTTPGPYALTQSPAHAVTV